MKKFLAILAVAAVLTTLLIPSVFAAATGPAETTGHFIITQGGSVSGTPKVEQYSTFGGTVDFQNISGEDLTLVSIEIITNTDLAVFPFEVTALNYYTPLTQALAVNAKFQHTIPGFRCRGDAAVGYYDMPFKITYIDVSGAELFEIVKLPVLVTESSANNVVATTTPKVYVSSFSTSPSTVVAGENFTLNVTLRNTSSSTAISNLKAQLTSDGTFNPVSGSSTIFVDSIAPGSAVSKSISLHAKADAAPGSYNVTFALSYDYVGQKEPASDSEVVSIPVVQVPKIQVQSLQNTPSEVFVGQDMNLMTSVNNTGKSILYNVNASFTDKNGVFADQEAFLGNIQPGASGAVDVYVSAVKEGDAAVTMTVTYEDENGSKFEYTDTFNTFVSERTPVVDPSIDVPVEPQRNTSAFWIIGIFALIAAGIAVPIILNKRKKKARKEKDRREAKALDEEYLKETNGSFEETTL